MKTVEETLSALLSQLPPDAPQIRIPLHAALGRVLAEDIYSTIDVPPADNSAVDGYVFRAADATPGALHLPISQRIPAGKAPTPLLAGSAARIFTGASIPDGADTVLMQEDCQEQEGSLRSSWRFQLGDNVRQRGQDISAGSLVLEKGARLRPQELGFLASVGHATVPVRRLRVAIIGTGDELVEPGKPLGPAQIYNSNRFTLIGLLQALGCEWFDAGTVADKPDALRSRLLEILPQVDAVISTGGVSVGEEDHVRAVLAELGRIELWKLAIKPGKPFAFGWLQNKPYFGLPGNPAAVLVTFLILVRPFLMCWMGRRSTNAEKNLLARANLSITKPGKRQLYLQARSVLRDGELWLETATQQSSGVLSSSCWAEGLAIVPVEATVAKGDMVEFRTFSSLLS